MTTIRPPDLRLVLRQVAALYDQGRFQSMLTVCRQAKQLASAAPAPPLAELYRQEGIALHCLRRHEEALAAYALSRATAPLDDELQVMLRLIEAMVHEDQGDARRAVAGLKALCESSSTPPELLGSVLLALGSALKDNDPLAAAAVYRRVLKAGDDDAESAIASFSLGNILTQVDELNDAARAYDAARASYASAGDLSRLADCIDSLGVVRAYQGAYAEALRLHQQALTYYRSLERPHDLAVAHQNKAWALLQLGQAAEALAEGRRAVTILRAVGTDVDAALADLATVPALCAVGRGQAAICIVDAVNRRRLPADSTEQAYASWMTGWVAHHEGNEELCVQSRQYAVAVYVDGQQFAAAREVGQFPHLL